MNLTPEQGGTQADWRGIVITAPGRPAVQRAADPAPGYYVSRTAIQRAGYQDRDPRGYVDATRVPYYTLPHIFRGVGYLRVGDLGAVINVETGALCYAMWADTKGQLVFEGSIALAAALGINSDARGGGVRRRILLCLVFPGTGAGAHYVPDNDTIGVSAADEYDRGKWGDVLADCYGEYAARISGANDVTPSAVTTYDLLNR
jgi:hypothetical protein